MCTQGKKGGMNDMNSAIRGQSSKHATCPHTGQNNRKNLKTERQDTGGLVGNTKMEGKRRDNVDLLGVGWRYFGMVEKIPGGEK